MISSSMNNPEKSLLRCQTSMKLLNSVPVHSAVHLFNAIGTTTG
jgi:hypothetical protein